MHSQEVYSSLVQLHRAHSVLRFSYGSLVIWNSCTLPFSLFLFEGQRLVIGRLGLVGGDDSFWG